MFFESVQTEDVNPRHVPELPPWMGPPMAEKGTLVPTDLELARSDQVVLGLPFIRAYRTGCALPVEVAVRQDGLDAGDFLDLHMMTVYATPRLRVRAGEPLPDRLLRWGVRYADGTKLTTLDERGFPPTGPLLLVSPAGDVMTGTLHSGVRLWLWPLPPPEPFELAVEWPLGGIGLTIVELDGAAIAAAARRSSPYWP